VHGVGGTWGALATGVLAMEVGGLGQVGTQIIAVVATYAFAGIGTLILYSVVNALVGMRVDDEDEEMGLDLTQHSEGAYTD
jgi:Amt family ammonium transporter